MSDAPLRPDGFGFLQFDLAPLQGMDPALLISGDDDLDGFVLALALAFNDIKTIHWFNLMLKTYPPPAATISPALGEWNGMRVQVGRWLMALTHEVIHSIARAHETRVLKRAEVRAVVRSLPSP